MALDEHVCIQWDVEAFADVVHALGFGFAAAVCEEDERDALGLEVGEGTAGVGKGGGRAE